MFQGIQDWMIGCGKNVSRVMEHLANHVWSPTLDQGIGGWRENKPFLFLSNSFRNFGTVLGLFMNWRPISEDIFCNYIFQ